MDSKLLNKELQAAKKNKDWSKGAELLEEWCLLHPEDGKALGYLAYFLMKLGRLPAAQESAQKSLDLDPENPSAVQILSKISKSQRGAVKRRPSRTNIWRAGKVIEGRYDVRGSKRGGMGEVYFAYDREIDRMVAIKTPLPQVFEDEDSRTRFYREAEAWIGLGIHPNICSAYYVRKIDGLPWLFIEYVGGGDLHVWLADREPSFRERLDLGIQIAAGMDHTHTFNWKDDEGVEHRGLVHRDLKPANVLMEKDGTARVTDFGLAGLTSHHGQLSMPEPGVFSLEEPENGEDENGRPDPAWRTVTEGGMVIGTPPYMAPEQWSSAHHAGPAVDIYAYGCILYEIFCGQRPFSLGKEKGRLMSDVQMWHWRNLHLQAAPPDPAELSPGLDGELAELMLACLAKYPDQRPTDFETIREYLKSIYRRVEGWRAPFLRPEPKASRLAADSLNNHGVSFMTISQPNRAVEVWKQALAGDPHHIEASYNLGLYNWRYAGAAREEVCRRMAEVGRTQATLARPKHLLGRMYLSFGEYKKAVASLRQAADLDRAAARIWKDLGLALCADSIISDDPAGWAEIRKIFQGSIESGLEDRHVIAGLALSLRSMGRKAEAEELYKKAAAGHSDMPRALSEAIYRFVPGWEVVFSVSLPDRVETLAITSDGRQAMAAGGGIINLWEMRAVDPKRLEQQELPEGRGQGLSATADGRMVMSTSSGGFLWLWEAETGRLLKRIEPPGRPTVKAFISPDGSYLAAAGASGQVHLLDVNSGRSLKSFLGPQGRIVALAGDTRRRSLLIGTGQGLGLWDPDTGTCRHELVGQTGSITAAAVSPDGEYCLTGGDDGILRVWDTETGSLEKVYKFENAVQAAAFSPNSGLILAAEAGAEGSIFTLVAFAGKNGYRLPYLVAVPMPSAKAEALEKEFREKIDDAKSHLAKEFFHEAFELLSQARALEGYTRDPEAIELSLDLAGRFPNKGLAAAWEVGSLEGHGAAVEETVFTWDSQNLLSAGDDGFLRLWDVQNKTCRLALDGKAGPVASVAVNRSGTRAVSGGEDGALRLWNLETGELEKVVTGRGDGITALVISPDGRFAVSGSRSGKVFLWNVEKGTLLKTLGDGGAPSKAAAMDPAGRLAITGGDEGIISVWDLERGGLRQSLEAGPEAVTTVAFHPAGSHFLTGSREGRLCFWKMDGEAPYKTIQAHEAAVNSAVFDPEGKYVLTGSDDRTLRLFETTSGQCLRVFDGHTSAVTSVSISRDGQLAASAGQDGTVRLWRLDWEPEVRQLSFWDEGARPYLEIFLTLRTPYHQGGPIRKGQAEWEERDFENFLIDLRHRGYGWLRPQGVQNELEEAAYHWTGPPDTPKTLGEKVSLKPLSFNTLSTAFRTFKGLLNILSILVPIGALPFLLKFMETEKSSGLIILLVLMYLLARGVIYISRKV